MNKYKLFFQNQYGAQKYKIYWTYNCLFTLEDNQSKNKKTRTVFPSFFWDFAEAFDTINHDIVLNKLEFYGKWGVSLNCFKSYLNGKISCVKLNENKSNYQIMLYVQHKLVFFNRYPPHIHQWHTFICPTISFICSRYLPFFTIIRTTKI